MWLVGCSNSRVGFVYIAYSVQSTLEYKRPLVLLNRVKPHAVKAVSCNPAQPN